MASSDAGATSDFDDRTIKAIKRKPVFEFSIVTVVAKEAAAEHLGFLGDGCCRSTNANGALIAGQYDDIADSSVCECMAYCADDSKCTGFEFNPSDQNRCELHRLDVTAADGDNIHCGDAVCYTRTQGSDNPNPGWADDWNGNGNGMGDSTARVTVKPAYADFGPQTFGAGLLDGNGASIAHNVLIADPPTGCAPFRNAGFVRGNVALVLRGGCKFWDKALYAQRAGATHLIILNIPGVDMVTRMVCPEIGKGDSIALDGVNYECSTGITIPTFAIDYDVGTRLAATANDTDASGELSFACAPPEEEEEEVEEEVDDDDEGGGEKNEEDEVENEEDDRDNNNNANNDNGGGRGGEDEGSGTTAENANNLCNNQADQMDICQPHLQQYCTDPEYGDSLSKGCPVLCNSCPPITTAPQTTARGAGSSLTTAPLVEDSAKVPGVKPTSASGSNAGVSDGGYASEAEAEAEGEAGDGVSSAPVSKTSTTTAPPGGGDIANNQGGANGSAVIDWNIWGAAVAAGAILFLVIVGYCTWSVCRKRKADTNPKVATTKTVPPASPRTSRDNSSCHSGSGGRSDTLLILEPLAGGHAAPDLWLSDNGADTFSGGGGGSARPGIRTTALGSSSMGAVQPPRGRSESSVSRSASDNLPSIPGVYGDIPLVVASGGIGGALPPPIGSKIGSGRPQPSAAVEYEPPIRPLTLVSERDSADYEDVDAAPTTPRSPVYEQPADDIRPRSNSYLVAASESGDGGAVPRSNARGMPLPRPSAPPEPTPAIGFDYSTAAVAAAAGGFGGPAVSPDGRFQIGHDYATNSAAIAAAAEGGSSAALVLTSFGVSTPAQSDYELDALRGQPGQVVYGTNNKGVASAVVVNGEPVYEIDAERGGRPALYAPVVQGEVDTASYNPELYEDFRSGLKNGRNARET
eukprot:gene15362-34850_t